MTSSLAPADVQHACTVLSSPALIRLITEIDDNGAVPLRGLARTLADQPPHQLRRATDQARALGLLRVRSGVGLCLSTPGVELADVYDAAARWARRHSYPAPVADFTSRVQHTLALLADTALHAEQGGHPDATSDRTPSAQAAADLDQPRDLLIQWLQANHQASQSTDAGSAA
ncbi:hypothetical protein RKD23_001079 [Streptomyces sp. SAI-170]|uniref:hypothetical protein n=1 Tax=Streptomyces sp. SAI-170 TaxID=3377729 RepID=UPI003C7EB70E